MGMVCSLVGLLLKVRQSEVLVLMLRRATSCMLVCVQMKWAAWIGVYCSLIYMANSKSTDDKKQLLSLFM